MLNKDRISSIEILSPEWLVERLGKFTSSRIVSLMQDKPYAQGFMSYVYQKVGEELTGVSVEDKDEFEENNYTRWGLKYENEALGKFQEVKKLDFIVKQKLITVPGTRFGCTPDGLIPIFESEDKKAWNVSTVEVKCFPTYVRYIQLALCKTPQDVKKANSTVYWQVLDQMDNCDCLMGYSVAYHPNFKAGNLSIVEYRKVELFEDFRLLKERKKMATDKFNEVREQMLNLGRQ